MNRAASLTLCAVFATAAASFPQAARKPDSHTGLVRVVLETEAGNIEVEVEAARAPGTSANFLRYVDGGLYDGGLFHRVVRLDNQVRKDVLIEVIQGGRDPSQLKGGFPPIGLERTSATGLRHRDGTISMARAGTDTATSDFFICIGDQPELDFGGKRNPDGQGFAAFGRVIGGMEVVRKIHRLKTEPGSESLASPVRIARVRRKA